MSARTHINLYHDNDHGRPSYRTWHPDDRVMRLKTMKGVIRIDAHPELGMRNGQWKHAHGWRVDVDRPGVRRVTGWFGDAGHDYDPYASLLAANQFAVDAHLFLDKPITTCKVQFNPRANKVDQELPVGVSRQRSGGHAIKISAGGDPVYEYYSADVPLAEVIARRDEIMNEIYADHPVIYER